MIKIPQIGGVVLAGGRASRMNYQDKGLVLYQGKALVSYPLAALSLVAGSVLINANRNHEAYAQFGFPIISDTTTRLNFDLKNKTTDRIEKILENETTGRFDGPLAGILAAMRYSTAEILLVMPCDAPLFGAVQLQRLLTALVEAQADASVAFDGVQLQPVFMAIKRQQRDALHDYLQRGERKVAQFLGQLHCEPVDFRHETAIFANINSLADLTALPQQQGKPC